MARKKKPKKTASQKKNRKTRKTPRPKSAASTSNKLLNGDPTSEAELTALFENPERPGSRKTDVPPRQSDTDGADYEPRRRRRILPWVAVLILVAGMAGYAWLKLRLKKSLVPEQGTLTVQAGGLLAGDVTISRDAYGVPHIKAQNLNDMAFGAGFAMASDRNFQIEFLKRMAYGRLAEVLGDEALGVDIYMRSLAFASLTQRNFRILSPKLQGMLQAFSAGINEQRRLYPKKQFEFLLLSLDTEEWKGEDSLALYQLFSFLLATNHIEEVTFLKFAAKFGLEKATWLFPVYENEALPFEEAEHLKGIDLKKITDGDPVLRSGMDRAAELWQALVPTPSLPASNNWVVSPGKAQNGKSLLANDTHLQLTVPAMWYMMNLECPEYRAAGVALPGTPIVALGTNGTLAWGATMVMADNQDIFLEQMRDEGGKTQYLYKGKWEDAVVIPETITIRGGKTHTFRRIKTRHGVLLNEAFTHSFPDKHLALNIRSDYGLAYRTSVGSRETTLNGIFEMASARNMKEARAALDKVTGIYLNVVYADEKNIGWLATGRYPARRGASGLFPRIGWTGEDDWDGFYAASENPSSVNPKEGYIATANHRIWDPDTGCDGVAQGKDASPCATGSELWVSSSFYSGDRANRALELLASKPLHTGADMVKYQGDTFSHTARRIKELLFSPAFNPALMQAVDRLPAAENIKAGEALAALKNFDGSLGENSTAAAIYENFAAAVATLTFADEFGGKDTPLWENFQGLNKRSYNAVHDHLLGRDDSPFWDNTMTAATETKPMIFAAALAEAIHLCEKQMGNNRETWTWGKIHTYYWRHQFTKKAGFLKWYLNRGPHAAGGDLHTLNQAGNLWGDSHDVWLVPAMRFIVDFSEPEPAQLVLHMGASGNAESAHYDDMIPLFTAVKHLSLPLKAENVEKQYHRKLVLKKGQ